MRTEVITADTVDQAVERILRELRDVAGTASESSSGRRNVIYFDGWDGLGASTVLRAVGRRLTTPAASQEEEPGNPSVDVGLEFSQIFQIDCSKWKSRRAMQRLIVEQLRLPAWVMEALDAQDEEDDYQGVGKGSRAEIPQVAEAINQHIQKVVTNRRFLVIFHNGSSEEIDLGNFGFPLSGYLRNKVLWSFQGRFRLYPRVKVERALRNTRTMTDVVLLAGSTAVDLDKLSDILRHEAEEVSCKMINVGGIDWPAAATGYFLYMMKLYGMDNNINDYDISTHGCNYWKCDGMIQLHEQGNIGTGDGVDKLWISADALHSEIQMDEHYYKHLSSPVERSFNKCMAYWSSPTYGFMLIPDPHGQIPEGMFQIFNKLCVLKLSACKFSFTSPPFLYCYSLRFLWLDHCQDEEESSTCEEVKLEDIRGFFQRILVLDVRYSNKAFLSNGMTYSMTQLRELNVVGEEWSGLDLDLVQSQLHNIRTLRVKEASVPAFFFSGMDKMELLDLSENFYRLNILSVECSSSLETVIINGSTNLRYISLERCPKLKNIFLSGSLDNLHLIGITGTAIETLDLSAVIASELEILYLLHCEKLCAIIWPPAEDRRKTYPKRLST